MSRPYYSIDRDERVTYLSTNNTVGVSLTEIICYKESGDCWAAYDPTDLRSLTYLGGRKFIRATGSINYRGLYEFGFRADDVEKEMRRYRSEELDINLWTARQRRVYSALALAHKKLTTLERTNGQTSINSRWDWEVR